MLALFAPFSARATPSAEDDAAIRHLIAFVKDSGLLFVRNGKPHDSAEAADHLATKYDHVRKRLSTAEEFIDHVASKSSMTGRPYAIRFADGTEQPSGEWLHEELKKYRAGRKP